MSKYKERYNEWRDGKFYPDPTPVEVPLGFKRPPSIQEMIRSYVRTALSERAAAEGRETFEEAMDFEVDDDPDVGPLSGYELTEMQEEMTPEQEEAEFAEKVRLEAEQKKKEKPSAPDPAPGQTAAPAA